MKGFNHFKGKGEELWDPDKEGRRIKGTGTIPYFKEGKRTKATPS